MAQRGSQPEFFVPSGGQSDPNALFTGLDPAATAVSQHLFSAGSSLVQDRLKRGWLSLDSLRFYFSVNNSYVKNKLRLIFFPFIHKNWTRLTVSQGEEDAYRAPRDDINAPDLYIPTMAFMTWVMLSAIVLGSQLRFTPEAFGAATSRGFAVLLLEVGALKMGYYLLSDGPSPPALVLVAWSGYKFAGLCVNLFVFLLFGTSAYYVALVYNAVCMAFFLRGVMRVSWLPSSSPVAGQYFRLVIMMLQGLFPLLLG
jgi:hypothetical protein